METTLRLLGKLGVKLPSLPLKEWRTIFEFLEFFMVVKEDGNKKFVDFDWKKVKEILMLLNKIQD